MNNRAPTPLLVLALWFAGSTSLATSQSLVKPEHLSGATRLFEAVSKQDTLPCKIWIRKRPRLDFLFRHNAGFSISCRLGLLRPGETLTALIRVTPEGHSPIVLVEEFEVPRTPPEQLTRIYSVPLNQLQTSMGGGFGLGSGRYSAEILLTDRDGHTYRKRANLKAGSKKEEARKIHLGLPAYSVAPLVRDWQRTRTSNGLRVTVLFHADNPGAARMYDWILTDLLQSLTSLLDEVPCESVNLIGFNLDRQIEIFRQEEFDGNGLARLNKTLAQMELVTIPYQALMKQSWQKFLVNLAQREAVQAHPDAVIILGEGGSHGWDKLPQDLVNEELGISGARFFYFKFYSSGGPRDGLETLVKRLHGRTFDVYSPETLERAIASMLTDLGPNAGRWGEKSASQRR